MNDTQSRAYKLHSSSVAPPQTKPHAQKHDLQVQTQENPPAFEHHILLINTTVQMPAGHACFPKSTELDTENNNQTSAYGFLASPFSADDKNSFKSAKITKALIK